MRLRSAIIGSLGGALLVTAAACALMNSPPIARFTVFPGSGAAPLDVIFDGTGSSDPDGNIVTYSWKAGDGASVSGSNAIVHHLYEQAGTFTASLTVIDDRGARDTTTLTIEVLSPSSYLQILDWQLQPYDNMFMPWVIVGHARNVSGRTLSYVSVEGRFYDSQGILLSSWFDNMLGLPAGVTWEFRIFMMDSSNADRVHNAEVSVGSCS